MAIAVTEPVAEKASNANGTSYAFSSYSPSANSLQVYVVGASGTVAAAPTVTNSGTALTWTRRKNQLFNTTDTLYVFTAPVVAAPGAITPTFDCTGDAATGVHHMMFEVTGHDVLNPLVQTLSEARTGANPTLTRSAANTANAYLAAVKSALGGSNVFTKPTASWTEASDLGSTLPTCSATHAYLATGETSTTVTFTCLSAAYGIAYIEVRANSTLAGTVAGAGTLTGALTGAGALAATVAGVGTLAGNVESLISLSQIAATVGAAGTLTGAAGGSGALASTVAAVGTLTGAAVGAGALAGTVAGAGTLTGAISGILAAAATIAAVGTLAGALAGSGALASTVAAVGTLTASLAGEGALVGTTAATGTLTAALAGDGALAASAAATGTLTGAAGGEGALVASVAGAGSLTGDAQDDVPPLADIAATVAAVGTLTGAAAGDGALASALAAAGMVTAALAADGALASSVAATGALTADLTEAVPVTALIQAELVSTSTVTGRLRVIWKPTMNYAISFSSHFAGISGSVGAGDVLCRNTAGEYVIANAAAVAAGGVPVGVSLGRGSATAPVMIQYTGEVDASIADLGAGVASLAIVNEFARIVRLVTPTPTDLVVGRVDAEGNVSLSFAVPRVPRYGSAAPVAGTWVVGDIVYNTAPTAGGFLGWVCTAAGSPGTWNTFGAITA